MRLAGLERALAVETHRLAEAVAESERLATQLRMSAEALGSEWNRSRLMRERLAVALTCSRAGSFHWHGPSDRFECDERVAELYGFRLRREMDSPHLVSRAHPADRDRMRETWRKCVDAAVPFRTEIRVPVEVGGMRWVVVAGKAHECASGSQHCIVGACTDISAAHFGQQMKKLADEMPQLIWIASADGRIEYANERWSEYTGQAARPDDASAMLRVFHRDDQLRIRERWLSAVARGDAFEIEGRIIDVAGHPRWFLVKVVPMAGFGGVIERWVGTCTEIDAQKRAQRGAVASLGHELRQPLTSIAAALHLVERRAPVVERERSMIERQVSRMGRMVTEMLGDGAGPPAAVLHTPVDVARALAEAAEVCAPALRERRLTFVCRLSPGLMVEGDHDHLVQVLNNVIGNAAKHSKERGSIFIRGWRSQDTCIIEVRDEGDGIAPSLLPRLFEPFVSDGPAAGHGLGLAIARGLVERHGGTLTAASEGRGKGCTFTITQPACAGRPVTARPNEAEPEPLGPAPSTTPRRVLVIDDSPDVTELLADAVRLEGHEVVVAQDSRSGLELALVAPFDVILLDVHMPAMDGCELARELRAQLQTRCPRLIAITGTGRLTEDAALFDRVLMKPVDVHLMLALVAGGGRRRRRSSRQPRVSR